MERRLGKLLARLTNRFHLPADMYLRFNKIEPLTDALSAIQNNTQISVDEIRRLSEKLEQLLPQASDQPPAASDWAERARQARDRKAKLLSFGPNALGLLVTTKYGLFAVDPGDSGVSANLLHEGCYSEPEYHLLKSVVTKDSDVLVVGAHIGAHAIPLSRNCHKLVAIEANPETYQYLRANLVLNSCANVTSYNVAASEKAEKIKFLLNVENSGGSKRMPVSPHSGYFYDDPQVIEIDALPLDGLIEQSVFDLILMDIEGSEYFALKGMQRILAGSKVLSVEFLPHALACVAGVGGDAFIDTILPHFNWMYLPGDTRVVAKDAITAKIRELYQANQEYGGIYFFKELSPEWLAARGIEIAAGVEAA